MALTLTEIKVYIALGTFDTSIYTELYHIDDLALLTFVATVDDVKLRRAVAANRHTPFRVLRRMYREDTDLLVKECAWERTRLRYISMFHIDPPPPPWIKILDPYDLPE